MSDKISRWAGWDEYDDDGSNEVVWEPPTSEVAEDRNRWHGWEDRSRGGWDEWRGWEDGNRWHGWEDRGRDGWDDRSQQAYAPTDIESWPPGGGPTWWEGRVPARDPPVKPDAPGNVPQSVPGDVPQSRTQAQSSVATSSADAAGSAVAVADARIFDVAFFQKQQDELNRNYKQHNAALKWFRESCEEFEQVEMVFSNESSHAVPQIVHPKGMHYTWNRKDIYQWRWQDMVAQMARESMEWVVEGPEHRSRGIVQCMIQQSNTYDHKRHFALKEKLKNAGQPIPEDMLYEWFFILTRDDGSFVALRPNYSDTKIPCHWTAVAELQDPGEVPKTGLGGSSGRGTYTHFKEKNVKKTLRFDAQLKVTPAP